MSAAIDPEALRRLERIGGRDLVRRMIDAFADRARTLVGELEASQARGDPDGVARAAHALRSGAGNLGATILETLATQIEAGATARADTGPLVGRVGPELGRALAQLEPHRGGP